MFLSSVVRFWVPLALAMVWTEPSIRGDEPAPRDDGGKNASASADRFLMLTNGQLLRGRVEQEDDVYLLTQKVGTMRLPRNRVEAVFDSVQAAYEYRLKQFPEGDADERMKLVHWCLNQGLRDQAREQLKKILDLDAADPEARAMLESMNQADARLAMRARDPEVQRTNAERAEARPGPRALDSAVLRSAQSALGVSNTPVIFDLPKAAAIRRAEEFASHVHPLLQIYCSKCHNENYEGRFQLVPVRTRAQLTPDALRTNLDMTLQLIDPVNPARSELLSSTLRPHGAGPHKRPIFPGSNDRVYQVLATWVGRLGASRPRDAEETRPEGSPPGAQEIFAADRARIALQAGDKPGIGVKPGDRRGADLNPSVTRPLPTPTGPPPVANQRDQADPDADQFPLPFAVTGKAPKIPQPREIVPGALGATPTPHKDQPADNRLNPAVNLKEPKAKAPAAAAAKAEAQESKSKKKPLTLDPSILERALRLRYNNPNNP